MSYRDMRNFTEIMRALHYPRNISMDNFRSPNFPLVAEILLWLVRRFEPLADLPAATDSEQDRVILIRSAVQLMFTKTNIRLNPKKLYQADGYAVKELLKPAQLLYQAMKQQDAFHSGDGDGGNDDSSELDVFGKMVDQSKILDVKEARLLASEITRKAANLSGQLTEETELREVRKLALGQSLELRDMENAVRSASKAIDVEIQRVTQQNGRIAADEANLDAKIEKRKAELERNRKRLATLEAVRPAYMDEFDELEKELSDLYEAYVKRYTTLAYLEMEYETHCRLTDNENGPLKLESLIQNQQMQMEEDDEIGLNDTKKSFGRGARGDPDDEEEDDDVDGEDDTDEDMSDEDEEEDDDEEEDSTSEMNLLNSTVSGRKGGTSNAQQQQNWQSPHIDNLARPSTGRGLRRPSSATQSPRIANVQGEGRGRPGLQQHNQPTRSNKGSTVDGSLDKVGKKSSKSQLVESDDDF